MLTKQKNKYSYFANVKTVIYIDAITLHRQSPEGESLETNIALIVNNATVVARIAVCYSLNG